MRLVADMRELISLEMLGSRERRCACRAAVLLVAADMRELMSLEMLGGASCFLSIAIGSSAPGLCSLPHRDVNLVSSASLQCPSTFPASWRIEWRRSCL